MRKADVMIRGSRRGQVQTIIDRREGAPLRHHSPKGASSLEELMALESLMRYTDEIPS
jgi:hypothetical protein